MSRFHKQHDKAIHTYYDELLRLKLCVQRGQMAESELVSNFTSSMKPFFLRAVAKPNIPKIVDGENSKGNIY